MGRGDRTPIHTATRTFICTSISVSISKPGDTSISAATSGHPPRTKGQAY